MPDSTSRPTMITREKGEDIRRYATATLTVGRNPDNPEEVRSDLVVDPCDRRSAASGGPHPSRHRDHLEAVHGVEALT
ncbi:hypothetical protein GS892_15415 [Rhodococcus hoagii]|nr:hypothetical protein [Prescottella equi]